MTVIDPAVLERARAKQNSAKRSANGSPPPKPNRTIRITTDIRENAEELIAALAEDPGLYQREGELVHVTRTAESESDVDDDGRGLWKAGTPRVRFVRPANLTERASTYALWEKFDSRKGEKGADGKPSGEWVQAMPSTHVVGAVAARGEWRGIRPLVSVAETPFLRPDGSVCDVPGYDRGTGVLLEPSISIDPIPPSVTPEMTRAALAVLTEPFAEFPWSSDASRSAALAAILTLVARPAIRGSIPAVIVDKNSPGTGGTLVADIISIIATGRTAPRLSWPANDEELEKVLGALAIAAGNLVVFDNIRRAFTGGPLDKVLTAHDRVQLRVLGMSEVPSLQWRALIMGTGNNVAIASDTIDRVMVARMETVHESPRDRTDFRIGDLRAWTRRHRAALVRAALVVLRGFVCAGRPSQGLKPWGSFEAFAALVPPAMVFAGAADPMGARLRADSAGDPEMGAYSVLLRRLPVLSPGGTTVRALVSTLYPPERQRGERCAPDNWDDLRGALETLAPPRGSRAVDGPRLGNALRPWRGRVVGGARLVSDEGKNHEKVARWTVEQLGTAGTAGCAGSVSSYARADRESDSIGNGGKQSPQSPQSPHSDGLTDVEREVWR